MPFNDEILTHDRIIITIVSGRLDDESLIQHTIRIAQMNGFDPSFDRIIDLTGVTENMLTKEGLRRVAELNPFNKDVRRANVVPTRSLSEQVKFVAESGLFDPDRVLVTDDRQAAYQWLLDGWD